MAIALVVALTQAGLLLWWGWSLGWRVASVRLIDATTGSPLGLRRGSVVVADVLNGPDPVAPFISPAALPLGSERRTALASSPSGIPLRPARVDPSQLWTAGSGEAGAKTSGEGSSFTHGPSLTPGPGAASGEPIGTTLEAGVELTALRSSGPRAGGSVLVIDGGRQVPLTRRMLIGRNPIASASETAIAIPDLSRELSKSHLSIEQDSDGSVFVTDLGSTNGTSVSGVALRPHLRVPLGSGSIVDACGHSIQVISRAGAESSAEPGAKPNTEQGVLA